MKLRNINCCIIFLCISFAFLSCAGNTNNLTLNHEPDSQYYFRVKWDNRYIQGITKVSGLRRKTEVIKFRSGGDSSITQKLPGRIDYDPIVLERVLSRDTLFETWVNTVTSIGTSAPFRKLMIIDLFNKAGQKVISFKVHQCWPSDYIAMEESHENGTQFIIESITIQHEGWERDQTVTWPN